MKKTIICLIGLLFFSCNKRLQEEVDTLADFNEIQSEKIKELEQQIQALNQELIETEQELTLLINNGDASNADAIRENNEAILENAIQIAQNLEYLIGQINTALSDIENVSAEAQQALQDALEVLESEREAIQTLIDSNVEGIEDLQNQINSIEPVINHYHTTIQNITQVIEEEEDDIVIDDSLCDSDYAVADDYVLPPYERHWSNKYWEGGADCDQTEPVIYQELFFVQFGTGSDRIFRTFTEADGWIGTYGLDENKMDIPGFENIECRLDETVVAPTQDESVIPSLGVQIQGDEIESDLEIQFEFDPNTGDYIGCINTSTEHTWYVNGVAQDSGTFNVGKYKGVYIITVVVDDIAVQHEVELTGAGKAVKRYGKVTKSKKVYV